MSIDLFLCLFVSSWKENPKTVDGKGENLCESDVNSEKQSAF